MDTFKRVEHKYLINQELKDKFLKEIQGNIKEDIYPKYSLHNVYYDSKDYTMIRKSIEGLNYKEKLRVRSYGNPTDTNVYFEIKKKYDGIVYKRRVSIDDEHSQVMHEINYMKDFYDARPKLFISYDREAYAGVHENDVRITFDTNIQYRSNDLSLYASQDETRLFQHDEVLMEIKVMDRYPLWLIEALSSLNIQRTSFSKYGTIYTKMMQERMINYV